MNIITSLGEVKVVSAIQLVVRLSWAGSHRLLHRPRVPMIQCLNRTSC